MRERVAAALTAAMLAGASPAAAQRQSVVYTNVVDGQRGGVVKVMRVITPAIAVPTSIVTTPVFDRRQYIDDLLRRYDVPRPAAPTPAPATASTRPTPAPPPWFFNGLFMGPSPTGQWMSVTQGRPIIDVRIISPLPPRNHTSSSRQERHK